MDALRAEAEGATRQREVAVTEAKAAAETLAKLRGDSSKYAERLSNLEVCCRGGPQWFRFKMRMH